MKHPGVALKEYQIATETFGRPADFDPHLDSLVRVMAGRLRSKLAEYYASEGVDDPVIVELPKGTYSLAFHDAATSPKPILQPHHEAEQIAASPAPKISPMTLGLAVFLGIAIVVIVVLLLTRSPSSPTAGGAERRPVPAGTAEDAQVATGNGEQAPEAVRVFWQPFTAGPDEPWVVFSNGAFIGRAETGLRYFNPAKDSREAIDDHYTGVGEVLAVHDLDHIFSQLHRQIRVKRGSLFSLDDAQNNNLIFVGSPAENLTLRDIPSTHEFIFQRLTSGPRKGDLAVINVHPQLGEAKMFLSTPPGTPLTEDYAIIGLVPGINPARSFLILAGTTTIGTQAAAEYVSRQDSLERLLLRLSVSDNGAIKPFEVVLRVKVVRGVPVARELVALRKVAQ
ncbi:MAG TPA: hypothetical protein VGN39_00535 [Terriglobales bacterium]|nr:hypothetical protein [Terriglobales bacterium]